MGDFNLALVIVAVVVTAFVFLVSIYLLVNYQHPDDANQAYFPKFVVVLGISIAVISILMLPADVANRQACRHAIYNGACNLTLPMKDLWLAVYIVDALLVFFIIPFSMFYYEGDQDKYVSLPPAFLASFRRLRLNFVSQCRSLGKRIKSAMMWVVASAVICGLVLSIFYADIHQWASVLGDDNGNDDNADVLMQLVFGLSGSGLWGKMDFTVTHLSSSATNFPTAWTDYSSTLPCVGGLHQCAAYTAKASSKTTWTMRTSFPEYVVALATVVGSVLFTIFGGVGIICLPLGLIFSFIRRPKAVITRSQYIKEATDLGKKARELKKATQALHQEERSGSKGRKWRKNVKAVEKELLLLEEDVKALEEVYPQGEQAEALWAFTVLGYIAKLVLGVIGYDFDPQTLRDLGRRV
ncbi:hypothetical protein ACLOJK_012358 [Asimina triloba]